MAAERLIIILRSLHGRRRLQSRVDTTWWQPFLISLQSRLRGSLVEQDVPAEFDVAVLLIPVTRLPWSKGVVLLARKRLAQ